MRSSEAVVELAPLLVWRYGRREQLEVSDAEFLEGQAEALSGGMAFMPQAQEMSNQRRNTIFNGHPNEGKNATDVENE